MIDIPLVLLRYIVRDGSMSRIIDSAPIEIMKLAKATDEQFFKAHMKHTFSNFCENNA